MKEIGGYIEFEHYQHAMLYEDGIMLNCGRNCLAYLILARNIKKIVLPYFLCDSIKLTCVKYGVDIRFYSIDQNFIPINLELEENEWLYIVNYYGQLNQKQIEDLARVHKNLIIDQSQAYFEPPVSGIDTLYSCRKFFGVSDGAILYSDVELDQEFQLDESFTRMGFLLGRFERAAHEFYKAYTMNNDLFVNEPIKLMSRLTKNLLHSIDYQDVKARRTVNYLYLYHKLEDINKLKLHKIEGAYAYPLYVENGSYIRRKLIEHKIYIPLLWPNVLEDIPESSLEFQYAKNILPLPCDQRYGRKEMDKVYELVMKYINL